MSRLDEAMRSCGLGKALNALYLAAEPAVVDDIRKIATATINGLCDEIDRLEAATFKCANGKANVCLDSPDGVTCACCGCVEMIATHDRLTAENAALRHAAKVRMDRLRELEVRLDNALRFPR